jgi:shikimate kinase
VPKKAGNPVTTQKSNIVLIGMPGAGKSTVGVILAKQIAWGFVDTDVLIQTARGRSLQSIVDAEGYLALRAIEEKVLLGLKLSHHVIATGGSAVYSAEAMAHLKKDGVVVFLNTPLTLLEQRIQNFATRGLAKIPGQSLEALFEERLVLYQQYADITIPSTLQGQDEICVDIVRALKRK